MYQRKKELLIYCPTKLLINREMWCDCDVYTTCQSLIVTDLIAQQELPYLEPKATFLKQ